MDYGKRPDGTPKGKGYFGEIKRPDGNVMTEISIGVGLNNKQTLIPLIVPTLNRQELEYLRKSNVDSPEFMKNIPPSIINKAVDYASGRLKQNKSPFALPDEVMELPTK
jgi:hypothetical protein